jgi:alpha-glucosidase (family GH31 glycosyl hydrolase)
MSIEHRVPASTGVMSTAAADPGCVVQGPGYRFSVLTDRLIRMEWSDHDTFVDLPTQLVQQRTFPVPDLTVRDEEASLEIWTEYLHLRYDKGPFSPGGLSVNLRRPVLDAHRHQWRYASDDVPGGRGNLGGTARTLDEVDGACELDPGLFSTHGYAVVDDSVSVLLTGDGWLQPRPHRQPDLYLFGYGNDYPSGLRDYFRLTGPSPLLPRTALGNWWSRFHRYTADDYLGLMDRFAAAGVPFSVAVLDMDWHPVDIDPALGNGWTGYTWDRELFPDPPAFLAALHERGLAVSLNVHPADGVRRHEAAYPEVARDLGLDPASGLEIAFDITDRDFARSYFSRLHHPHEAIGVDFWWIDWQSGTTTRMDSVDPLWALNHLHYHDAARHGRRPWILSRYAGLGSHRYPVGFSGDTVATWASLDFQPYFTATAANVGYFWWSHDLGGHGEGAKDGELAVRWYQFGVFSPISRLHSSNSPFNSKEPWRHEPETARILTRYLRLRHQLVPYLYTATWTAHTDGIPPVRPMYHDHPDAPEAYEVHNQYLFGPDLIVAPITTPAEPDTHLARVDGWLPPGTWYDFFTGHRYTGGRTLTFHRTREHLPVLARAGAVIPLAADPSADVAVAPADLELRIFPGASGRADIIEDDGRGAPTTHDRQRTSMELVWRDRRNHRPDAVLTIAPPGGPGVRTERDLTLTMVGVIGVEHASYRTPGGTSVVELEPQRGGEGLHLDLGRVELAAGIEVTLNGMTTGGPTIADRTFDLLDQAEISYALKDRIMSVIELLDGEARAAALHAIGAPDTLFGALLEILASDATS